MRYLLPVLVISICYNAVLGTDEATLSDSEDDSQLYRVRRGGLSMLRLGRGLQMLRLGKRSFPMLRLGRSAGTAQMPDDLRYFLSSLLRGGRQVPLPRYGKAANFPFEMWLEEALKSGELDDILENTQSPYSNYYDFDGNTERQIRPAPRPGMRRSKRSVTSEHTLVKRTPPYPRFGKEVSKEEEIENAKDAEQDNRILRVPPLSRIGRHEDGDSSEDLAAEDGDYEYDADTVKRAMRMLRLGRGMRMLRLGKRPMSTDGQDFEPTEADKRALRLLRLGKRPFKMLRLGRSEQDQENEKRALGLLRLGKKSVVDEGSS